MALRLRGTRQKRRVPQLYVGTVENLNSLKNSLLDLSPSHYEIKLKWMRYGAIQTYTQSLKIFACRL
ncbi:MAG: hypothetical protein DID90_2727553560 [Candidatus Nitrotoga sp. LAW]|nr:MAG: hypothetical protein DID90_2727553560 [Candidatus Nitrotoga sp. LAW]